MTVIRLRRGSSVQWTDLDPVLLSGEQGYEIDTHKYKIGDGFSRWTELEYYLPTSELRALIDQALIDIGAGDNAISPVEFEAHINSSSPHPVYDDGPSLTLLYQNAKV